MRKISAAAVAFAALTSSVSAQDAASFGGPVGEWGGFYAGLGFGQQTSKLSAAAGRRTLSFDDSATVDTDFRLIEVPRVTEDAVPLHGILGYRHQWDRFLAGVEGDLQFGGTVDTYDPTDDGIGCPIYDIPGSATGCVELSMFGQFRSKGHLRGTAGIALTPSLMAFGAAGLAFGEGTIEGVRSNGIIASSPSSPLVGAATVRRTSNISDMTGWSLGGGVEFKVAPNFIIRGEYIYDDYGTSTQRPVGGAGFGGTIGTTTTNSFISTGDKVDVINETVRVSLIYRTNDLRDAADWSPVRVLGEDGSPYGNWGGFYLGGGGGTNSTSQNLSDAVSTSVTGSGTDTTRGLDSDDDFFSGHVLAGYRHQLGRFVLGVEGDAVFGDEAKIGTHDLDRPGCTGPIAPAGTISCAESDAFGSFKTKGHIRGVAGFEVTPTLMGFASAGVAFGEADFDGITATIMRTQSPFPFVAQRVTGFGSAKDDDLMGLSLGGGLELKVAKGFTVRGEYVYDRFEMDIEGTAIGLSVGGGGTTVSENLSSGDTVKYETHSGRVSLIYSF
jgi:opacity protein-like surface antigen